MDGSVDRDTPDELSFSAIVITVYFIWGVIFLLLVIALCIVGLVPLANNLRYFAEKSCRVKFFDFLNNANKTFVFSLLFYSGYL